MKKRIIAFVSLICIMLASAGAFACSGKSDEEEVPVCGETILPEREYPNYELDATNATGISKWSNIAYVTAEAKALGYSGSEACQHLTTITRGHKNKNLMFIGTDAAGICKSTDGGRSWKPCINGLYTKGACRIEIDPKNDNHIVVVNVCGSKNTSKYSALMYSFDCGETWTKSEGTRGIGFCGSQYYYDTLEFDESSYDEKLGYCKDVYFSAFYLRDDFDSCLKSDADYVNKRGIYKSSDGGASFEKISGTDNFCDGLICIKNGVFAIADMNGIFVRKQDGTFEKRSDMCVQSFEYVNGKYYILSAGDFRKGSTDKDKLPLVSESDGIYVSEDLKNFEKITDGNFPDRVPRNLAVSSKNPQYMLMFARKRVDNRYSQRPYYSKDGGKSWTLTEPTRTEELFYYYTYHNGVFSYDPDDENTVVGIIGGEVIRSTDGGETLLYSGSGVSNVNTGAYFNFNIYDENLLYIGAYDFGGAFTADGGKTWKNISLSKDGDGKDIMGGYAADENTLFGVYVDTWTDGYYFSHYRYVCFSHDGGKKVNIDPSKVIKVGEYKNTDKTDEYASLNVDSAIATSYESSYQSPNNKNVLFCANYRSTDGGYNWKNMLETSLGEKCLQVYTHIGNTLYGCSKQSGYVLKSTDDGKSWHKVNAVELEKWRIWDGTQMRDASGPSHITDIAVDAKNGYIYAAYYRRLFRMKLDGTEITMLNDKEGMVKNNFNTYNIRSIAVDPNCPEIVYCCGSGDFYMDCESVRRSCNSGESWQTVTPSGSKASVVNDGSCLGYEGRCVRVRPNGEVWISTQCLGMSKLTPPYPIQK